MSVAAARMARNSTTSSGNPRCSASAQARAAQNQNGGVNGHGRFSLRNAARGQPGVLALEQGFEVARKAVLIQLSSLVAFELAMETPGQTWQDEFNQCFVHGGLGPAGRFNAVALCIAAFGNILRKRGREAKPIPRGRQEWPGSRHVLLALLPRQARLSHKTVHKPGAQRRDHGHPVAGAAGLCASCRGNNGTDGLRRGVEKSGC